MTYSVDSKCQSSDSPVIMDKHVENLSTLSEKIFPNENLVNIKIDDIWKVFDSLPVVTGIDYFEKRYSRCFSNQTFNENFNVYLIANAGDGDCVSGLELIICKGNTILSQKEAGHGCGWETGSTQKHIIFISDTIFKIVTETRMNPFDSNKKIVRDKFECKSKVEKYKIASNGGLMLIEESEDTWIEKK